MARKTPWLRPEQVEAGEGIDVTEVDGTVTVAAEEASASNKGVAKFDADNFTVAAGAVSANIDATPVNGELKQPVSSDWAHGHENDPDVHDAVAVNVEELGTASYDDVQDFVNFFGNRTFLSGCAITATSPADGTVAIAAGTAWCKESDSNTAVGKFFDFTGHTGQALTDLTANLIYLDYNGGTPQIVVATSALTYGHIQDHILLGAVFRNGTDVHILQADPLGIQGDNRSHMMRVEEGPARTSGAVTSATGTRNLSVTAGVLHLGLNRKTTPPYTTPNAGTADATEANKLHDADGGFVATDIQKTVHNTTDDTYTEVTAYVDSGELTLRDDIFVDTEGYDLDFFTYWYYDGDLGTPAWVQVKGQTAISNSQYNAVATGLANLTANRYGVHWVYMDFDGDLHVVYGQGDYTANQAEEAAVPASLPNIAKTFSVLIAKIICQQGTDTMTITYPWTSTFASTLATDHGSLGGLSGDDHPQYVKDSEFTQNSGILVGTGAGTFAEETGATLRTSIGAYSTAEADAAIDTDVATHAAIKAANAALGHVTVEDASLIDVDADGKLTLGAHKDTHDPQDGSDPLDTAAPSEIAGVQAAAAGSSHSLAKADHGHQIQHGIADNHIVTIDDAAAASGELCRFTANGVEGVVVDDSPVNGSTTTPISSNWAYDVHTSRARAYVSNVQTIPHGPWAWTRVRLDAEDYDGLSEFDISTITGTADATEANKLHDADGGFSAANVGYAVWNTTDNTYAVVSAYVDSGELTLDTDIMVNGETYLIYKSRFKATAAGYYMVSGGMCISSTVDGAQLAVGIKKNTAWQSVKLHMSAGVSEEGDTITDIAYLAAGDTLTLWAVQNMGANRNVQAYQYQCFLAVHRLS